MHKREIKEGATLGINFNSGKDPKPLLQIEAINA